MLKIATIIGARPQIIKAAAISRAISSHFAKEITEIIIHTGQHYDLNMSDIFFDELRIPTPNYNLGIGSSSHGRQTAEMIIALEQLLIDINPDFCLIYGDTNSTLAGAIASSKLNIPIVHVEAGLRSFNRKMPEEINRVVADKLSTLLFSPTSTGLQNLLTEGLQINPGPYTAEKPGVFNSGDIMYDNTLFFTEKAPALDEVFTKYNLSMNSSSEYILCTVHRPSNTDKKANLKNILMALIEIASSSNLEVIFPMHPRTKKVLEQYIENGNFIDNEYLSKLKILPPVSFLDMIALGRNSQMIITDSGGVQKEAYFLKKHAIILRNETEWVEIVENGKAILTGSDYNNILEAYEKLKKKTTDDFSEIFGNGNAAVFILNQLLDMKNETVNISN